MIRFHARTDVGLKRRQNEDALLALEEHGLFVVADGVGGRKAGELASALTVDTFQAWAPRLAELVRHFASNPTREARNDVLAALDECVNMASARVYEAANDTGREGMTSTMAATLVGGGVAFVCHVGDSRVYLRREGTLRQITEDHSMVNDLLRSGGITPEEAARSRYRNVITRAVGLYPSVSCDAAAVDLVAGDRLLICSDGLSDLVKPERINDQLANKDITAAVEALVDDALAAGGKDNITVVALDPEGTHDAVIVNARARVMEGLFLFQDLPYQARIRVGRMISDREVAPGETIVRQGEAGDTLFVVVSGQFSVQINGREVTRLGEGEHFGELSLIDETPRSATIISRTQAHLLTIDRASLRAYCALEPGVGNRILWRLVSTLSQRLRAANDKLRATGHDA